MRLIKNNFYLSVLLSLCTFYSVNVMSATVGVDTKVLQLLSDRTEFGGCMARLSVNPGSIEGLSCKSAFVSLDCNGGFISKVAGGLMFSAAQLSYVTGRVAKVFITDDNVYNGSNSGPGYCTVTRIQNK